MSGIFIFLSYIPLNRCPHSAVQVNILLLSKFQVVSNRDTQETLLCTAYVFEVSTSEHGAQHHIYKLVKD